jgi:hypothetical protein
MMPLMFGTAQLVPLDTVPFTSAVQSIETRTYHVMPFSVTAFLDDVQEPAAKAEEEMARSKTRRVR